MYTETQLWRFPEQPHQQRYVRDQSDQESPNDKRSSPCCFLRYDLESRFLRVFSLTTQVAWLQIPFGANITNDAAEYHNETEEQK